MKIKQVNGRKARNKKKYRMIRHEHYLYLTKTQKKKTPTDAYF